jgi:hypothetical protein
MNKEQLLPILREMGYKPFNLAIWDGNSEHPIVGNACELVGYPFVESNEIGIMIRTRIGDPTSMVKVPIDTVYTVEYMASEIRRLTQDALIGKAVKINELAARLEHLGSMICNHREPIKVIEEQPQTQESKETCQKLKEFYGQSAKKLDDSPGNG